AATRSSTRYRASSNSTCSRDLSTTTSRSMRRIRSGRTRVPSKRGPSRRHFVPPTRMPARISRSTSTIRNSRVSRSGRPYVEAKPQSPRVFLRCRTSHRALVGVDDLTSGGEPHPLALLHVSDGALQVFDAKGLAGDHRMQRNAHDPRLLAAIGVQRIGLIDHRAEILLAGVALADEEGDVVDLVAIGNREHFSRLDLHLIRLIVVVPVAAILHAFFRENVERVVGLDQPGAEPAARPLSGRLLDRLEDRANGLALLLRGKSGERV